MPNYDGTGPLKRGRVIGRGLGPCSQGTEDCTQKVETRKTGIQNETVKE